MMSDDLPVVPPMAAVPDDLDQVLRLRQFRDQHPQVNIRQLGDGTAISPMYWMARFPAIDGRDHLSGFTLRNLLDRLDRIFRPDG